MCLCVEGDGEAEENRAGAKVVKAGRRALPPIPAAAQRNNTMEAAGGAEPCQCTGKHTHTHTSVG